MKKLIGAFFLFSVLTSNAQEVVSETFDDTRVVNGHSVETNKKGSMKMIISHRFGVMSEGLYDMFGLDASEVRIGFDYGISDKITVGIGRSSEKTADGYLKVKVLTQKKSEGSPISLTWFSSIDNNFTRRAAGEEIDSKLRWSYVHQALIARKFGEGFSLQIMPTFLHRNLTPSRDFNNDIFSIGTAGRVRITQMLSLKAEYYFTLPDQLPDNRTNSLAVGFDIETKHHVFQLHVGNSRGMTEKFFISETMGKWEDGDIMLGFNITRDFQIAGRKYK